MESCASTVTTWSVVYRYDGRVCLWLAFGNDTDEVRTRENTLQLIAAVDDERSNLFFQQDVGSVLDERVRWLRRATKILSILRHWTVGR